MVRRLPVAACVLALAPVLGCGGSGGSGDAGPFFVRVLDRAREGVFTPPSLPAPPQLLGDTSDLAVSGPAKSFRSFGLSADGPLIFEATAVVEGLTSGRASLVLAELPAEPSSSDPGVALAAGGTVLASLRLTEDTPGTRVHLVGHPSTGARWVGLLLHLGGGEVDGASCRFVAPRLAPARDHDLLLHSARGLDVDDGGGEPGAVVTGHFALGAVSRPAVALPRGGSVELPVTLPGGGGTLELFLGALPLDDAFLADAPESLALAGALRGPGSARLPFSARVNVGDLGSAAWTRVRVELTDDLEEPGEARLVLEAPDVPRGVVPLLGAPRILREGASRRGWPNVVVVSVDTLRADHLGAYGSTDGATPHLDELAREAVVFEHVWSQSPYTLPAHVSLFSGQFPTVHGVKDPGVLVSPGRTRLLGEILAERGYATGAFTGGGLVGPNFGFARGFDRYGYVDPLSNLDSVRIREHYALQADSSVELARGETVDTALGWIRDHADVPFFLFFHTYAAHEFDPPVRDLRAVGSGLSGLYGDRKALESLGMTEVFPPPAPDGPTLERLEELYLGAIHQSDAGVGRILEELRDLDLLDETILVVTSDHGKELGDHGLVGHGHSLYEELLRVPLLLRVPGHPPGRVEEPVMLVDVAPTVLDLLGLEVPLGARPGNLLEDGMRRSGPLWAEVDAMTLKRALYVDGRKTIDSPLEPVKVMPNTVPAESFDLAEDPREQRSLPDAEARVAEVRAFLEVLEGLAQALGDADLGAAALDEGLRERLVDLGYSGLLGETGASDGDQ